MARNFKIKVHRRNHHLHLRLRGTLDGSSAWEVLNLIQAQYRGQGNVFIDARELTEILPFGARILQGRLAELSVPLKHIIFKGEKGYELAPGGCRVLVVVKKEPCACKKNSQGCTGGGLGCCGKGSSARESDFPTTARGVRLVKDAD